MISYLPKGNYDENNVELNNGVFNERHVSLSTRLGKGLAGGDDVSAVCRPHVFSRTRSRTMDGRHVYVGRRDHEFDAPEDGHDQVDGSRTLAVVDTSVSDF